MQRKKDTIIYAASGVAHLVTRPNPDADIQRDGISPGDFALVPPWTEFQVVNDDESDQPVVWVVIQSGPQPIVVNLTDWGGAEVLN